MTMTHENPGDAFLHTRALLEHPRLTMGANRSVTFDATIKTASAKNTPHSNTIRCSLRYAFRKDEIEVLPGVYDFEVKVSTSLCLKKHIGSLDAGGCFSRTNTRSESITR